MITINQYFGSLGHTLEQAKNAELLLSRVNTLLEDAKKYGVIIQINPKTKCEISGTIYGGFRPIDCPQGAEKSSHKEAKAVDIYDPENTLDGWLDDIKLLKYDLYRENPDNTLAWCHLSTKAPPSGRRTFYP